MLETLLCVVVALYLLAGFYALAESLNSRHTLTRGWRAKARVALEAAVWPLEALWLELPQLFSQTWRAATPRYQGVGS